MAWDDDGRCQRGPSLEEKNGAPARRGLGNIDPADTDSLCGCPAQIEIVQISAFAFEKNDVCWVRPYGLNRSWRHSRRPNAGVLERPPSPQGCSPRAGRLMIRKRAAQKQEGKTQSMQTKMIIDRETEVPGSAERAPSCPGLGQWQCDFGPKTDSFRSHLDVRTVPVDRSYEVGTF